MLYVETAVMSTNFYILNSTSSCLILSKVAAILRIYYRSTWNPEEAQLQYDVLFNFMEHERSNSISSKCDSISTICGRSTWNLEEAEGMYWLSSSFKHTWMIISYIITHISSTEYDDFDIIQTAPESNIFHRSRLNLDEARLQTLIYTCIKFPSASSTHSLLTHLHKVFGIWKK